MGPGSPGTPSSPISPKVFVIDFRPAAVPKDWNRTDALIDKYVPAMMAATQGTLAYRVAKKARVLKYPPLIDGRRYDDAAWKRALAEDRHAYRDGSGNYVFADYARIIKEFNVLQLINSRAIDEVWMFGGPYFGFYESRMVGKDAFWCNAPPLEINSRRFVMMGFNYQRQVREMVHNFGHRAESILGRQFQSQPYLDELYKPGVAGIGSAPKNDFEKFLQVKGTVHRTPGGQDYDQDEMAWVTALNLDWYRWAVDPNNVR